MKTTTFKTALTLLALSCGALTIGCDNGGPSHDPSTDEYRVPPNLALKKTVLKVKLTGCDALFANWEEGIEFAPEEWLSMMYHSAKLQQDEALISTFAASEENQAMCSAACDEIGLNWDGGGYVAEGAAFDVGDISIVGECPYETIATSMDVHFEGDVGCDCVK